MASRFTLTGISRLYYAKIQTPCRGSIGVSEHSSEAAQHSTHSLPESHSTGLGTIQQRTWKSSQTSVGEDKVLKKVKDRDEASLLTFSDTSAFLGFWRSSRITPFLGL